MIDYIFEQVRETDRDTVEILLVSGDGAGILKEVIQIYLIGHKGVRAAVNREISVGTILNQLPDVNEQQLGMVADCIRGLKAAVIFLSRT